MFISTGFGEKIRIEFAGFPHIPLPVADVNPKVYEA
jgi:hypothetical protein